MKWNNLQEQETSIKMVLHACPKSLSCIMHQLVGVDPSNIKADVSMHLQYKLMFGKLPQGIDGDRLWHNCDVFMWF